MGRYLVTGVAGFIGWKVAEFLLADGHSVVGVDNLNDAYDVRLKHWRLAQLEGKAGFTFHQLDICDRPALADLFRAAPHPSPVTHHSSPVTPHSAPVTPHSSLLTHHSSLVTHHASLVTHHVSRLH